MTQHRRRIAGTVGVVNQSRQLQVAGVLGRQQRQHPCVQRAPARLGQRLLDDPAREFVAVAQVQPIDHEQAMVQAFLKWWSHTGRQRALEQPALGAVRNDRNPFGQLARGWREAMQPRKQRVAQRQRAFAARVAQQLGDEEGVAFGDGVQVGDVSLVAASQRGYRFAGQPGQSHALQVIGRHLGHGTHQWMRARDLLFAISHHDERRQPCDAPGDELQEIAGRVVSPVGVLDDHEARSSTLAHRVDEGLEQLMRSSIRAQRVAQVAARLLGEVDQRPERARCGKRLAGAPQHASAMAVQRADEGLDQSGLADAGLAADEHAAAASRARSRERRAEQAQRFIAFEEHLPRFRLPLRQRFEPPRTAGAGSQPATPVIHRARRCRTCTSRSSLIEPMLPASKAPSSTASRDKLTTLGAFSPVAEKAASVGINVSSRPGSACWSRDEIMQTPIVEARGGVPKHQYRTKLCEKR